MGEILRHSNKIPFSNTPVCMELGRGEIWL